MCASPAIVVGVGVVEEDPDGTIMDVCVAPHDSTGILSLIYNLRLWLCEEDDDVDEGDCAPS